MLRDAQAAVTEAEQRGAELRREFNVFAAEVQAAMARRRSQP